MKVTVLIAVVLLTASGCGFSNQALRSASDTAAAKVVLDRLATEIAADQRDEQQLFALANTCVASGRSLVRRFGSKPCDAFETYQDHVLYAPNPVYPRLAAEIASLTAPPRFTSAGACLDAVRALADQETSLHTAITKLSSARPDLGSKTHAALRIWANAKNARAAVLHTCG